MYINYIHYTLYRYSIECLASYIEVQQFQQYLMRHTSEMVDIINVHSDIPQSSIIANALLSAKDDDILQSVKLMAYKLYHKYIKIGATLEINISAKLRRKFEIILDDEQKLMNLGINFDDLLLLFEQIKHEMILLLKYSHRRFQQKEEYRKMIHCLSNNTPSSRNSLMRYLNNKSNAPDDSEIKANQILDELYDEIEMEAKIENGEGNLKPDINGMTNTNDLATFEIVYSS